MLVSEIIDSAARKIGALAGGESLKTHENANALLALQVMLRSWSAIKMNVFASVHETHTLVAGTNSYTWGTGGVINTARPNKVIGASITDSLDITHPVEIRSEKEYREISLKTLSQRSYTLFPLYGFPYVTLYLFPVPNAAETLNLESLKPFTETSSFSATSDTIQLPVFYEEAVIYNLAVRVAPEIGVGISPEVAEIASTSFKNITTLNSSNQVEPVKITLPVNTAGGYNINSDGYR